MALIPDDPKTLMSRRALAEALTAAGYKTAPATLARLASVGGGPEFAKYGRWPLYPWGLGLGWAKSRLSPLVRSTAEFGTLRAGASAAGDNPPTASRQRALEDQPAAQRGIPSRATARRVTGTDDWPDAG